MIKEGKKLNGVLGGINDSGIESQPHKYETVFEEI